MGTRAWPAVPGWSDPRVSATHWKCGANFAFGFGVGMEVTDYRPLTDKERTLLAWLLEHGPIHATNFLPQLAIIEARSSCSCGCPSIEFSVPVDSPFIDSPQAMRAHFVGRLGDDEVGLMLAAGNGVLSELEVSIFGEVDHPFDLPAIDTLQPAS